MRMRINDEFYNKGLYYRKNYNTGVYATVGWAFKFKPYKGEKSAYKGNELIQGWLETDEGRTIITKSSITFQREDKIKVDGVRYFISEILTMEDETLVLGNIRNRPHRNMTVLVLG